MSLVVDIVVIGREKKFYRKLSDLARGADYYHLLFLVLSMAYLSCDIT